MALSSHHSLCQQASSCAVAAAVGIDQNQWGYGTIDCACMRAQFAAHNGQFLAISTVGNKLVAIHVDI
jgi:hypothetical protein